MRSNDLVLVLLACSLGLSGCNLLKKKKQSTNVDQAGDLPPLSPPPPTFTPPPQPRIENFAGAYVSNFGTRVVFTQFGRSVESNVTAAHGRISCIATGILLDCTWVNGGARGRETLIKQSDGTLKGTFGNGSSTTGGSISFKPV